MTVKNKSDGFAEMREEFELTRGGFDRYAEQFWHDVRDKQQRAAPLQEEILEMQSALDEAVSVFDAYAVEFQEGVDATHDAAADFREQIDQTREEFDAMVAEFEADAVAKQDAVAAFEAELATNREAIQAAVHGFEQFVEAFEHDVDSMRQDAETLLDSVEAVRKAHEQAREELARAVVEFYGYEDTASTGGDGVDAESVEAADDEQDPLATEKSETVEGTLDSEEDPSDGSDDDAVAADGFQATEEEIATEEPPTTEQAGEAPDDMVECLVCGEYYQAITESHLQTHDTSMSEYKSEYGPDVALYPGVE